MTNIPSSHSHVPSPGEEWQRADKIDSRLRSALHRINNVLRRGNLPMGVKEDLVSATDDIEAAVASNDATRDQKVAALQAQIDLLSANPTEPEVRAQIDRLKAAKDKLLADADA